VYIELHTASAFSFLEGASLPEALVERAADLGYPALGLLDRDGLYGVPRFHKAAVAAGVKPIIGSEITIKVQGANHRPGLPPSVLNFWQLPILIETREGYENLARLITKMKLRAPKGKGALELDELEGHTDGLVALIGRPALMGCYYGVGGLLDRLLGVFGRTQVYVELQRHLLREEEHDNQALLAMASAYRVPVVATNGVRFAEFSDRPMYDVLTCIRHKTTLDQAGQRLHRNAERYLKPPMMMEKLFLDLPDLIGTTHELANRLGYTMVDLGYRFPDYPVPPEETMDSFLQKITEAGARGRYRPYHARARRQVVRELDLIQKLKLAGYFLIVWDIVNYCRRHGILVQGRGSAANSAVCYSLGITAVDPVGMELLFERFLSEERGQWPDIDLDLPSGEQREQVIQHVYTRYGQLGASMVANVITYRGRNAAREIGKVLSIDSTEIDQLVRTTQSFEWGDSDKHLESYLHKSGSKRLQPKKKLFSMLWKQIQNLPRHLGQHSGGMVIAHGRLDEVVPLENASMPNRTVVQWDKDDCAEMGIVKVDLLGLGMLAVIQEAMILINTPQPRVDLAHLPPDDPEVYRMLQQADTIGVFQVESRAQMATLPRLKPKQFYDIVVEVAIIRPGPIVGQMVHPYLDRRSGREPVTYPHPLLKPILKRTLGVPLFQEQLLRIAMVAAGFTGGEAEELRRAMGFKRSVRRMQQIETKLRDGMKRKGLDDNAIEEIVQSITSFALYGFPESHAASFALLVYASAYLKAHYPAAFYTALLNNQPMGFYSPATLVKDAQRRGVRFTGIDVQHSNWECKVEEDGTIRLGLSYVSGLRKTVGRAIASTKSETPLRSSEVQDSADPAQPINSNGQVWCPKCWTNDLSELESDREGMDRHLLCNTCSHDWTIV
jgi:error-prone DNA polymerase